MFKIDSECHIDLPNETAEVLEWCMPQAGKMFKLNVPITGTAKIGESWAEIH